MDDGLRISYETNMRLNIAHALMKFQFAKFRAEMSTFKDLFLE